MARPKEDKKDTSSKYPSPYGSHQSMIDPAYTTHDPNYVVCKDEEGPYVTEQSRLDSGLADPYRYAENRNNLLKSAAVPIKPWNNRIWPFPYLEMANALASITVPALNNNGNQICDY